MAGRVIPELELSVTGAVAVARTAHGVFTVERDDDVLITPAGWAGQTWERRNYYFSLVIDIIAAGRDVDVVPCARTPQAVVVEQQVDSVRVRPYEGENYDAGVVAGPRVEAGVVVGDQVLAVDEWVDPRG